VNERVEAIRKSLKEAGADAFICYSYPNYRYLSGFTGSLAILLISTERAIIMSDFRYRTQIAEEVGEFEFVEIKGPPEETVFGQIGGLKISKLAFESRHLTYRNYAQLKRADSLELIPTEDWVEYRNYAQLKRADSLELIPTEDWVEDLRAVKDDSEIGLIEKAASIADAALERVVGKIWPGMTEQQVANRIKVMILSLGGKKEAFDLIVASGPRSAMPHGASSDRPIEAGEPIVIDIGAQFEGYHSDLTRTVWLDKMRSRQVVEIYDIVENAQAAAIGAIRPGMPCAEVDAVARDLIAEAGYGELFGHGLGHGVGLEVHESPVISRLGKGKVKPGMVFTVEPGIYIPGVGGVRIEDMIVVTDDGCRRLVGSAHRPEITVSAEGEDQP
jgi:Xaa-Pro aminopeptidase